MSNFEEILKDIGEFGLFQKSLVVVLCVPTFFSAFDIIGQVFIGISFPHHCNTDWILERAPNLTEERQRNLTIPVDKDGKYESCRMFTPVDLDLETIESYGINSTIGCVAGWDYDAPQGASSFVTEFDVVCDRSDLIKASQSISMAGILVGALTYGALSDRFGRRFAILLCVSLFWCFGMGIAFSPNMYVYMFFKFFSSASAGVTVMNTSVMALEWTDRSKSALCTQLIILLFPIGLIVLSGVASLIHDWRILQLVLMSPFLLVVGFLYWFLPESARWLMTQGRKEEAVKELERAAKMNGRTVPDDVMDKLTIEGKVKRRNMLDIFRIPYLRKRIIIMGYNWFAVSLLYYGLSLNVGGFGLNIYLTQFIFGLVEIPSYLGTLVLVQRFGRRICQACFLFFGGVACLVNLAIPDGLPVVVTIIAVLGKMAASAAFSTVYIYTPELYPTVLRQNGVGLNSMCARVGGIISPLIWLLQVYHDIIPMLVYGIVPVAAGGFCWLLPETLNVALQDQAELKEAVNDPKENRHCEEDIVEEDSF